MAGRFFVLVICAFCIASIESDVGSLEKFNRLLQQYRKRLLESRLNPSFRNNSFLPFRDASNISPVHTLVNQINLSTKTDSFSSESKNETNQHLDTSGEYIPTGNPVVDDFSQSTQENSSITAVSSSPDVETSTNVNQTTNKVLIEDSSPTGVVTESSSPSTRHEDLSKDPRISTTDAIASSIKEELSSVVSDNSTGTFLPTNILISTTSSSKEVSDDNTTSTELSTTTNEINTSISGNSDPTTEKINTPIITSSTQVSEGISNISTSTESTVIADKTELTTQSEINTASTSTEKSTEVSALDTTADKVLSTSSTKSESSSVTPKEITVTDQQKQSSTKVTGITNGKISSVFPDTSTIEEETTISEETKHVIPIYNPTITTVKLALSITFMVIAFVGFTVLVAYMVKRQRQTIPYEELSLEP